MSLILDALRKSDMERSRHKAPEVAASGARSGGGSPQRWLWPVLLLLLTNALFLGYLLVKPATMEGDLPGTAIEAVPDTTAPVDTALLREPAPAAKADVRSLLDETLREAADSTTGSQPAGDRGVPEATPTATVTTRRSDLPEYAELAASGRLTLAPLALELHVFAEQPGARFVFVNGQKAQQGQRLNNGARVVEITPFGVILEHDGVRFVLPRD